jgi:phosphoglycerate dehydrogenase-like enzyme
LTPHCAGSTAEAHAAANVTAAEIVVGYMRGNAPSVDCIIVPPKLGAGAA